MQQTVLKNPEAFNTLYNDIIKKQDEYEKIVRVCIGTGCAAKGSRKIYELFQEACKQTDKKIKKGLAEPLVKKLEAGSEIQFERKGFCRLDKKEKSKLKFWFSHK